MKRTCYFMLRRVYREATNDERQVAVAGLSPKGAESLSYRREGYVLVL